MKTQIRFKLPSEELQYLREELYKILNPDILEKPEICADREEVDQHFICIFRNGNEGLDGVAIVRYDQISPKAKKIKISYHFLRKIIGVQKTAYIIMMKKYFCEMHSKMVKEEAIELVNDFDKIRNVLSV